MNPAMLLCALVLCLAPGLCPAAPSTATRDVDARVTRYEPGRETRAWLDLQRSGERAGPAQAVPGPAASFIYQRYLNSFKTPIPALFDDKSGAATGSQ